MRALPRFADHTDAEAAPIEAMKRSGVTRAVQSILHEGQSAAPPHTLLSGWAYRFKTLSDGRRQILNFLLAGDFIRVQQKMHDASAHGVKALTDVVPCVVQRDALWELHRSSPTFGFAVTRLTAREESVVDDTLLSVGCRNAEERVATLLFMFYKRAMALQPSDDAPRFGIPFPLTRKHIADGPGLSLVHTHKTLRKLERRGLHHIEDGRLCLLDLHALTRIADLYGDGRPARRPLI